MTHLSTLRVLVKFLFWIFCSIYASATPSIEDSSATLVGLESVTVTKWTIIGPFFPDNQAHPLEPDYLAEFGTREGDVSHKIVDDLRERLARQSKHINILDATTAWKEAVLDFQHALRRPCEIDAPPCAAYAMSTIRVEKAQTVQLLFGSNDGAKVWVNGTLIIANKNIRILSAYDECIPVYLKEGENIIVAKVWRRGPFWKLCCRIEPSTERALLTSVRSQGRLEGVLLKRTFIPKGENIEISVRGGPINAPITITVTDRQNNSVMRAVGRNNENFAQSLGIGVYKLIITSGELTSSEHFCVGSPEEVWEELKSAFLRLRSTTTATEKILIARVEHLLNPDSRPILTRPDAIREWEKKLAHIIRDIDVLLFNTPDKTGLHFHGFHSRIDGTTQGYRLFVPRVTTQMGVPLIVIMPPAVAANRPFMESALAANHAEAEQIAKMAECNNMSVLWVGYRSVVFGQPSEITHFEEVLEDVEKYLPIDRSRIYLVGLCGAAPSTAMVVKTWPRRFAAVGLLHPELHRTPQLSVTGSRQFSTNREFLRWSTSTDPFTALTLVPEIPKLVIYDGAPKGHGDEEHSLEFVQAVRDQHTTYYERHAQSLGDNMQSWGYLFEWLSKQRNLAPSDVRDFSTYSTGTGAGPLSRVFSNPFTIVVGTSGSEVETASNRGLASVMADKWKRLNFSAPGVENDIDVLADISSLDRNLVVIGNRRTNLLWKSLEAHMDVDLEPDRVRIRNRVWRGLDLAIQCVGLCPTPDNPQRLVAFVGSASGQYASQYQDMDPPLDGWFDFAVWEQSRRSIQLLSAGSYPN